MSGALLLRYVACALDAFRFYFGRLLQVTGLSLTAYVAILFFDPMNKESRLLSMTCIGVACFAAGHLLLGTHNK